MPARLKSPKEVIRVRRRKMQEGAEVIILAKVTRVDLDSDDNPNRVTVS